MQSLDLLTQLLCVQDDCFWLPRYRCISTVSQVGHTMRFLKIRLINSLRIL